MVGAHPKTGKAFAVSFNDMPVNSSSQYFYDPNSIAVTGAGRILVADGEAFGGGGIIGVDPATGKESEVSGNDQPVNASSGLFVTPESTAFESKGKLLVADSNAFGGGCGLGCGGIIGVKRATGKESEISSNKMAVNAKHKLFFDPVGIAIAPSGALLVVDFQAFGGSGGVIKVNPRTGRETRLSSNNMKVNSSHKLFNSPNGIMVTHSGRILVTDPFAFGGTGGVIGVNPRTGRESKVSANNMAVNSSSQYFTEPLGMTPGPTGGILIADQDAFPGPGCPFSGCGGVIGVNRRTGKESRISSNTMAINSSSQVFDGPNGLAVMP